MFYSNIPENTSGWMFVKQIAALDAAKERCLYFRQIFTNLYLDVACMYKTVTAHNI